MSPSHQSKGAATLVRELSVVWLYDGTSGYEWRAILDAERHSGRADTEMDAWIAGLHWLSVEAERARA